MEIKFEFESSYKGKLTIDGKEMEVSYKQGVIQLNDITEQERLNTVGGIVADEFFSKFFDVMQAWAIADEHQPNCGLWGALPDEVASAIWRKL